MTDLLSTIAETARQKPQHIVLPEGEDERILQGALKAAGDGLAKITVLGVRDIIGAELAALGAEPGLLNVMEPDKSDRLPAYAEAYYQRRRHKGLDQESALAAVKTPLTFAAMMVAEGDADGTLGGAVATTADTVRTAFQVIGKAPGAEVVSSVMLMVLDQENHPHQGTYAFADCALIVEPSEDELMQIALASGATFEAMTGEAAKVAMLSFSTCGSASHPRTSLVASAASRLKAEHPALEVDGEIQFDAAIVPSTAASKAPGSRIAGKANVLIFPSLEAGNIGYKIAQRMGGAKAIGPILQGLARPANDLSRGCNAEDIYHMIAVTAVQAQK